MKELLRRNHSSLPALEISPAANSSATPAMNFSRLARRAETLAAYSILDTDAEMVFDQLTRLVSRIFQTPISTLTFLDRDRQWFKSRIGVEVSQTPLSHSLCYHAANDPEGLLLIGDALQDERFWDHPAVTEDPHLRFYAGVPLIMKNGESIGALCAADSQPREIGQLECDALRCLRDFAVTLLEARRLAEANERNRNHVRHLQALLPICCGCRTHRMDDDYQVALDDYLMVMRGQLEESACPHCVASLAFAQ